ncbi:MORC family CW-type zinc finger protein 3 Nuclear matrix protein 2 [Channa argus]|uniref:MORC family CW-type zinc finger protein 3 Nuclear matrix protein 2 n=1 Tax=Channa argus TaxID=215402 RepID=A0A6G1PWQ2_CHAAH|nr:MORC family CW-type zinc finger protein 3 Nuclear matrix protein 2 [Channa argus]
MYFLNQLSALNVLHVPPPLLTPDAGKDGGSDGPRCSAEYGESNFIVLLCIVMSTNVTTDRLYQNEQADNAYDPDVNAKQFWIDKTLFQGEECLTFMDNGNGLNHNSMHKMLSFGYSDKTAVKGVEPIGIYGNGFKSGSMRLGRDAIVFSKSKTSSCVGMLSQTYLEKIDAQQITLLSAKEEHKASLQDILRYSPFTTKEDLITEFNAISHPFCTENTGTRIIIWNLRRTSNETGEFDFEKDRYDIQIPSDIYEEMNGTNQYPDKSKSYIPESVYSLRANNQGVGVIGVIECNYLDPTHNKQSFNETDKYRKTINNLGIKLEEYWKEIRYKRDKDHPNSTTAVEDIQKRPDQNWVQCDDCLRWRKLSDGIDISKLPEKWFCRMNPDPQFRSCQVDEEPEDSDEDQPSYRKTYKLQPPLLPLPERVGLEGKHYRGVLRSLHLLHLAPPSFHKLLGFDLTKVKTEEQQSETNVNLLLECSEDAAVDDALVKDAAGTSSTGSPSVGTSPSIAPPPGVASITTQTEISKMKKEQDDQIQTDERVGQSTSKKDAQSVNHDEHASQNEVRQHLESNQAAGPFCADACDNKYSLSRDPVIIELQEQQDKLLELMQATALERDSFKEQVHKLTCQLQDMQNRVQELCQVNVKKECSSQASQTEETVGTERGENYQSLFENAKKKVDELIMEKENLLEAIETKSSSGPGREKDIGEVAFQVDRLLRELDQTKKEKDELRSQLDSVEEERANLAFQCEKLRLSLQQQRPNTQKENTRPQRVTDSSVQTNPEWAEGTANSGTNSSSSTLKSLIELRQNIGHLLITYVPALDLGQVNYECNVIDEILGQVVQEQLGSMSAAGESDESRNDE